MDKDQRMYTLYLLRLWQTKSEHDWVRRASLENPDCGNRIGFANLQELFGFLEETIMGSNFEWQKHQVKERIDSALGEARSHRIAYQSAPKRVFSLFGLLNGLSTTSKELLSIEHKTDIPATQPGEHLIDY